MSNHFRRLGRHFASPPARFAVLFAAAAMATSTHVRAQTDSPAPTLAPVVVTAARSPQQLGDVLADVTVVSRADIERLGYGDLSDLLRGTGAVELSRNGGPGSTTSLFVRGAETRHTMVLLDGVRVDDQATGGAHWESIPLSQVDHIEIVKGPASAMYGSDAIGGVVQIFTRKGDGPAVLELGVAGGSLRTGRADANLRGSSGIFDYALSAATEHSGGFVLVPDPTNANFNPQRAGYQKHNWSARLGAQLDPQDRLELTSLASHLNSAFNDYSPTALGQSLEDTTAQKLSWSRQWMPTLKTQLSYGESKERYNDLTDIYLSETRIRSYSLDGSYDLTPEQRLLFVLERREDWLSNSSLSAAGPGVGQRSENAAALGYLWHKGPFDFQAHIRRDSDSEFGDANTGSLGLGYRLTQSLRVVGSVGNAFRAPTIFQNSSVYGPLSEPNGGSLSPEKSRNEEIGLKYADAAIDWSITAYRSLVSNLINFGAPGDCLSPFGCYVNVQEARLQGVSLAGGLQWGIVHLSGTLDLQAPKDLSTGNLLPRRSREFGTLHAQTLLAGWDMGASVLFSGRRYDDSANTEPLGGYALLNLDATVHLTRELNLQINLDNVFNRAYQTALGYAQPPHTILVGLRYTPSI